MKKPSLLVFWIFSAIALRGAIAAENSSDFGLAGDGKKFTCEPNKRAEGAGKPFSYTAKGLKCDPKDHGRDASICKYESTCSESKEVEAVVKTRPVMCAIQTDGKCPTFEDCFKQSGKIMKADSGMEVVTADGDGTAAPDADADAKAKADADAKAKADADAKAKADADAKAKADADAKAKADADAKAKADADAEMKKRSRYDRDRYRLKGDKGPTFDAGVSSGGDSPVLSPPPPAGGASIYVSPDFMAKVKELPENASHMDIIASINRDPKLRELPSEKKLAIAKQIDAKLKRLKEAKAKNAPAHDYKKIQEEPILMP